MGPSIEAAAHVLKSTAAATLFTLRAASLPPEVTPFHEINEILTDVLPRAEAGKGKGFHGLIASFTLPPARVSILKNVVQCNDLCPACLYLAPLHSACLKNRIHSSL